MASQIVDLIRTVSSFPSNGKGSRDVADDNTTRSKDNLGLYGLASRSSTTVYVALRLNFAHSVSNMATGVDVNPAVIDVNAEKRGSPFLAL